MFTGGFVVKNKSHPRVVNKYGPLATFFLSCRYMGPRTWKVFSGGVDQQFFSLDSVGNLANVGNAVVDDSISFTCSVVASCPASAGSDMTRRWETLSLIVLGGFGCTSSNSSGAESPFSLSMRLKLRFSQVRKRLLDRSRFSNRVVKICGVRNC